MGRFWLAAAVRPARFRALFNGGVDSRGLSACTTGSAELRVACSASMLSRAALTAPVLALALVLTALHLAQPAAVDRPTVSSIAITSKPAAGQNGYYKIDDRITFTVTFSEAVGFVDGPSRR